jgi:DNA-directed RNA polymerase subunit RPC12/RpoP
LESAKKQCLKCGKKLTFLTLIREEDLDGNEVTLCEKCYPNFKNEQDKKREERNKKDSVEKRKKYVQNVKKELIDYYCSRCNTEVDEDEFRCPECKSVLSTDGAIKIRKVKRDLIAENNSKPSGMTVTQVMKKVRVRGHGLIKLYCPVCDKTTDQEIQEQRPLNWMIIGFIPIPYNSKKFNIWYKCQDCEFIVGTEEDEQIKEEIIERYPETSEYEKGEAKMQVEVCDVCFFEENKKVNLVKWEQKLGNVVLHLCEKHRNWIDEHKKKGKLTTQKELMTRISKWYDQD